MPGVAGPRQLVLALVRTVELAARRPSFGRVTPHSGQPARLGQRWHLSNRQNGSRCPMPLLLCPNCNEGMQEVRRNEVQIDVCPKCRGVWLDRGELERLLHSARVVEAD
jgi:hypothetical protein